MECRACRPLFIILTTSRRGVHAARHKGESFMNLGTGSWMLAVTAALLITVGGAADTAGQTATECAARKLIATRHAAAAWLRCATKNEIVGMSHVVGAVATPEDVDREGQSVSVVTQRL